MKRLSIILLLFFTALAVASSVRQYRIDSPGATGMNSQVDVDAMKSTDAVYLENTNTADNAGLIQRRKGLIVHNLYNSILLGAFGYYDPVRFKKAIVGTIPFVDSIYLNATGTFHNASKDSVTFADSTYYNFPGDHSFNPFSAGIVRVSDSFGNYISLTPVLPVPNDTGTIRRQFCGPSRYQDFTIFNGMLIHCDGTGLPSVFEMNRYDYSASPDTIKYEPNLIDLSPPRPTQPRVRVLDIGTTTSLFGNYEYCYAIEKPLFSDPQQCYDTGYHSIVVSPKNECVLIDGFIGRTFILSDTSSARPTSWGDRILLFRRRINDNQGYVTDSAQSAKGSNWKLVKDFYLEKGGVVSIIDSGQQCGDTTMAIYEFFGDNRSMLRRNRIDFRHPIPIGNGLEYSHFSSDCQVAWSWYDPITGIESGLSMVTSPELIAYDSIDAVPDTFICPSYWSMPYLTKSNSPTDFFRIYRSVAGDTNILYCIYQAPVDESQSALEWNQFLLGFIPDSMILKGAPISFDKLDQSLYIVAHSDSFLVGDSAPYTYDNISVGLDGDIVIRPPVISPLTIPFKDMDYINGRLWGIGDPLYPQRLYYSGYENINDWNPIYYLSMNEGENDELVAIEKIEGNGGDHLIAFKHNSIYDVFGSDPEYDLSISRMTADYGALSRFCVIKSGNAIYFMDTEKRIHRVPKDGSPWLSYPIQDYIDSTFTETDSIRTYELSDRVCFRTINGTAPKAVVYNKVSGTWSVETSNLSGEIFNPSGSFRYDTLQNHTGFDQFSYWMYESTQGLVVGDGSYLWTEYDADYDSVGSTAFHFPFAYQTPWIGDGDSVYQIQSVRVTAEGDSGQYIYCSIYDLSHDLLVKDSAMLDNRKYGTYEITMKQHSGLYLSARITGRVNKIRNIKLNIRGLGRVSTP